MYVYGNNYAQQQIETCLYGTLKVNVYAHRLCKPLDGHKHLKFLKIIASSKDSENPIPRSDEAIAESAMGNKSWGSISELVVETDSIEFLRKKVPITGILRVCNHLKIFRINGYKGLTADETQEVLLALPESLEILQSDSLKCTGSHEANVKHLKALKSLDVGDGHEILTYKSLEWITNLQSLERLSLTISSASDYSFAWLKHLPNLRIVCLNMVYLGPSAFAQLCWVKSLQQLSLEIQHQLDCEQCEESKRAFSHMFARGVVIKSL